MLAFSTTPHFTTDIAVLLGLLTLSVFFPLAVFCFYRKRDKIRTASPPHGSHMAFTGGSFKVRPATTRQPFGDSLNRLLQPVSPSTYQMARDNMENALLEKCPMIVISSDYAEPDFAWCVALWGICKFFCNVAVHASFLRN